MSPDTTASVPPYRSSQGYTELDRLIRRFEVHAGSVIPGFAGYAPTALVKRLAQRAVEVSEEPFLRISAHAHASGDTDVLSRATFIRFGILRFDMRSGACSPSLRFVFRALLEFVLHWLHVLGAYLISTCRRQPASGPATLLFGVGIGDLQRGGDDARFLDYCHHGPIVPLARARRIIAQAVGDVRSTEPEFIEYTRYPLHRLTVVNPPRVPELFRFLRLHLSLLVSYFLLVARHPVTVLLGRDIAYHALAVEMNARQLLNAILLTNSNYSAQPLWMTDLPDRQYRTHFILYSTNTFPVIWGDESQQVSLPIFRHMRADDAWVWNQWHAGTFSEHGMQLHIVGPILWYLPDQNESVASQHAEFRVVVFDVTPFTTGSAVKRGLIDNYYTTQNMLRFIGDIVDACDAIKRAHGRQIRITLKHKRSYRPIHDRAYIAAIERLVASGTVELAKPEADLYSLIGGCDVSIVVPFSSPAYVADYLGLPAMYYDPTGRVLPNFDDSGHIIFVQDRESLVQQLLMTCNESRGRVVHTAQSAARDC